MRQITETQLFYLVESIFTKAGSSPEDAKIVAEMLVSAELRGIPSHGVVRIKDYIGLWQKGRMNLSPKIKIVHEMPSTATVDGDNGMGMVVGNYAMNLAIKKANEFGSGWVAVRNSNHFGIAGFYTLMAAEQDMMGFAFTNANALVAPTFGVERMLGTNPIAFSIPGKEEPTFTSDLATTSVARGKIELMEKEGKKVPIGLIQDSEGNPTDDPSVLRKGGTILPLDGQMSSKGFCLGAMVDILSAVLSGANFGPFVPPQVAYLEPKPGAPGSGLGHFFGAIRLDGFRPANEVKEYLDLWIRTFRNSKPAKGRDIVIIPGEIEIANTLKNKEKGITIMPQVWEELLEITNKLGIDVSGL